MNDKKRNLSERRIKKEEKKHLREAFLSADMFRYSLSQEEKEAFLDRMSIFPYPNNKRSKMNYKRSKK